MGAGPASEGGALASEPSKKFRLNAVVNNAPRQVSCPDVALGLEVKGYTRALLLEYETTLSPKRMHEVSDALLFATGC